MVSLKLFSLHPLCTVGFYHVFNFHGWFTEIRSFPTSNGGAHLITMKFPCPPTLEISKKITTKWSLPNPNCHRKKRSETIPKLSWTWQTPRGHLREKSSLLWREHTAGALRGSQSSSPRAGLLPQTGLTGRDRWQQGTIASTPLPRDSWPSQCGLQSGWGLGLPLGRLQEECGGGWGFL